MIDINDLKKYTKTLTILFADDAPEIREMYHYFFDSLFKSVISTSDGDEALKIFEEKSDKIDLILTDQSMPNMNGIDMIKKVREVDSKIPIILVTATKEQNDLINAINLNVTNFIEKPIKYEDIINAIENAIQKVVVEELTQKNREQELEILKYKSAYSNFQEGEAFKKQLNIIKNDIYKRRVDLDKDVYMLIDHYYQPKDTLSGDTYSIHTFKNEKKLFFFIIDAMGKGISASVSTLVSTSFINYYFETNRESFDFEKLVETYIDFIGYELLEDEIISALFGLYDMSENKLKIANFSMPPVLGISESGEIRKLSKTNLPITPYSDFFRIDEVDMSDIRKFIFYSDGLTENITDNGLQYLEYIGEDFQRASSKREFMEFFRERVKEQEDDTTLLYFEKLDLREHKIIEEKKYFSTVQAVDEALEEFGDILSENHVGLVEKMRLEAGFTELIMNAYEHGNLGIGSNQKQRLMESGEYTNYLKSSEVENSGKNIMIQYYLVNGLLVLNIQDEGSGFDTNILKALLNKDTELFHGRGIMMSDNDFDFVIYNEIGNSVLCGKKLSKKVLL
jgi:CheY-like chemotaxis protein/anti-sigma regulatory factor (Ser/Thr protein kinase)